MNIKIKGGQSLNGEITPSGSKNSAVALIPASLLFDKKVTLHNIPDITDVNRLVSIMEKLGSRIEWKKESNDMIIDNSKVTLKNLDSEDLGNMKGTSLLWGPMLARFGEVVFEDLPGGCTLGIRPLDAHYQAFKDLGVLVEENYDYAKMDASRAHGRVIWLSEMSVTATENVIMLATGIKGTTKIIGAASEPQVQDLCKLLIDAGARITGVGSSVITVDGEANLSPVEHTLLSDHYEITTFWALAAATGGNIVVHNSLPGMMDNIVYIFKRFGIDIKYDGEKSIVEKGQNILRQKGNEFKTLEIKGQPWPGLPVDTLPLFIPLALAGEKGQIIFHNWMYEAGLFWTSELSKMNANTIIADPHRVIVTTGNKLRAATLEAPYIIRAVVALVMTAMMAEGETTILNADALYRGHPNFSKNLEKLGAEIVEV